VEPSLTVQQQQPQIDFVSLPDNKKPNYNATFVTPRKREGASPIFNIIQQATEVIVVRSIVIQLIVARGQSTNFFKFEARN